MTDDMDLLAAELALGVLEGEDRAEAMRLKLSDVDFALLVQHWTDLLAPLGEDMPEAEPTLSWPGIERRMDAQPAMPLVLPDRGAVARLRWWRGGAIAAGAVAAGLALMLLVQPLTPSGPDPVVIAQLRDGSAGPMVSARYDPAPGTLSIRAAQFPISDLTPELWVIPADGLPRSLGQLSREGMTRLVIAEPYRALIRDGAELAVTMEQKSPTPHEKPSTISVAIGRISTI